MLFKVLSLSCYLSKNSIFSEKDALQPWVHWDKEAQEML